MLIYNHNKYLKQSYSIKSRSNIWIFLMREKQYIRDGFLKNISRDLKRSDLFIKNDRLMRMTLCISNNNLICEWRLEYQILTEVHLSFISNHSPFYEIQKSLYFKTGSNKKYFIHPKNNFIGSPIYEKELMIKLGCVGLSMDSNYKYVRRLWHFKEVPRRDYVI